MHNYDDEFVAGAMDRNRPRRVRLACICREVRVESEREENDRFACGCREANRGFEDW